MLKAIRYIEVVKYGWLQSKSYSEENSFNRIKVFFDMLISYCNFQIWSNQYVKESFFQLSKEHRKKIGEKYRKQNKYIDNWYIEYYKNIRFLKRYSKFSLEGNLVKRKKRQKEYTKWFKAGKGLYVEYGVILAKQHYSDSQIVIGENVHLGREIDLDYTGGLIIGDNVSILEGVKILTHEHDFFNQKNSEGLIPYSNRAYKCELRIKDHVTIGARAVIMPGVNEIGRGSVISACSYVRNKVPPYAIVMGNPARIVGFRMTPKEIVIYEKDHYSCSERYSIDELENNYNRYFKSRIKEIKEFIK